MSRIKGVVVWFFQTTTKALIYITLILAAIAGIIGLMKESGESYRDFAVNISGEITAKAVVELSEQNINVEVTLPPTVEKALLEALARIQ